MRKRPSGASARRIGNLIRHIVFFSARRREDIPAIMTGLSRLGDIPGSTVFEVSLNNKIDPISDEIDVVVYGEFPDEAALLAYKTHPLYAESTGLVRPLRELRFSADVGAGVRATALKG